MSCRAYSVSADSLQSHDHLSYTDTAHGGDIDDSDVTTFSELSATELAQLPGKSYLFYLYIYFLLL